MRLVRGSRVTGVQQYHQAHALSATDTITRPHMSLHELGVRRVVDDFRFALLRHWTLYDAMRHSTYVAVRLQTWTDSGQRKLQELLARMGFLLSDCCHDYGVPHAACCMPCHSLRAWAPGSGAL